MATNPPHTTVLEETDSVIVLVPHKATQQGEDKVNIGERSVCKGVFVGLQVCASCVYVHRLASECRGVNCY